MYNMPYIFADQCDIHCYSHYIKYTSIYHLVINSAIFDFKYIKYNITN